MAKKTTITRTDGKKAAHALVDIEYANPTQEAARKAGRRTQERIGVQQLTHKNGAKLKKSSPLVPIKTAEKKPTTKATERTKTARAERNYKSIDRERDLAADELKYKLFAREIAKRQADAREVAKWFNEANKKKK
jgi:hypothetical protein